jgi:hypothetical protein
MQKNTYFVIVNPNFVRQIKFLLIKPCFFKGTLQTTVRVKVSIESTTPPLHVRLETLSQ